MFKTCMLATGLMLAQTALAADIDFKALIQRLPAWPANTAAAAQIQAGGNAVSKKLADDLKQAGLQLGLEEQNRAMAGTGLAAGADPAQAQAKAQAMAAQMQGMSQQQQIAMAMQMQQQMQSNMGLQAAIPTPAESQAMAELNEQRMHVNEFMAQLGQLSQRVVALHGAAGVQHQQIRAAMDRSVAALYAGATESRAACEARARKQKQIRVDALNQQVAIADKLLLQLQPVYAEQRKLADDERQRLDHSVLLAAKIGNGALQKQAAGIVAGARQTTLSATQSALSPYDSTLEEAHWATDRDSATRESTVCDGGEG